MFPEAWLDHPKDFTRRNRPSDDAAAAAGRDDDVCAAAIAVADDRSVQPHHYNGTTCQSGLTGNAGIIINDTFSNRSRERE